MKEKIEVKDGGYDVHVLGFRIERRTNFTALAAFILSMWGALFSVYNFFRGSDLELVEPKRIMLFRDSCHYTGGEILNILVPTTIVNRASKAYSSVVRDIHVEFFLGRKYVYDSESYANVGSPREGKLGLVGCDNLDSPESAIFYIEELGVEPIEVIGGGNAIAKNIIFVPKIPECINGGNDCYTTNYLKYEDAIMHLNRMKEDKLTLRFNFLLRYDKNKMYSESCVIPVNSDIIEALQKHRHIDTFCLAPMRNKSRRAN